jgi:hypothetical protein
MLILSARGHVVNALGLSTCRKSKPASSRRNPGALEQSTFSCLIRSRTRWRSPAAVARENEKGVNLFGTANHSPQMSNILSGQVLEQLCASVAARRRK